MPGPPKGSGGRPPKPIELKRRLGTDRPDRTPRRTETIAIVAADGAPVPMALGAVGRETWRKVTTAPWIGEFDLRSVEIMCRLDDDEAEMSRVIAAEGMTVTEPIVTPAGMVVGERVVPHPLLKPLLEVRKQRLAYASAHGFDPTARARLGLAEVKARTKLQELQERSAQRRTS